MTKARDRASAASVRARLLQGAHERGEEFQRVLVRYANERLLYRLSLTPHASDLVLKGATLFAAWTATPHRATKDVDLLGRGAPDPARLAGILRDVFAAAAEPDGLVFDPASLAVGRIREGEEHQGVRARFEARLGSARVALQVDVGFGDALALPPEELVLPTLLDHPAPRLRAYRREQVVAEKLHVMVDRGLLNTRMKDYFDLFVLARTFDFDGASLAKAIEVTFERRKTALPRAIPDGLSDDFGDDRTKQAQWRAFLRRSGVREAVPLAESVRVIRAFVLAPVHAIAGDERFTDAWSPRGPWSRANDEAVR